MDIRSIAVEAEKLALVEIEQYSLPSRIHFDLSMEKGIWLAERLGADVDIVKIGISFMDLKIGQAMAESRLNEHVMMSAAAARQYLEQYTLNDSIMSNIVNCIEAHHGDVPYTSLEAEICANADCYRFLHPKGVLSYLSTLGRRLNDFPKELIQVQNKMQEKMGIVTIPIVKQELEEYYNVFSEYIKKSL